jgi:uncharacterized protein (DUF58 family)
MTRGRLTYLALLVGLLILHIMLVDYISYYIIILFLFLPCISLLVTFAFLRNASVEMSAALAAMGTARADMGMTPGGTGAAADGQAARGDEITLELRVRNSSFIQVRTRIDLVIRNELTGSEERESIVVPVEKHGCSVRQSVLAGCPGEISFRVEGSGVYDPLGIFCFKTKRANSQRASLVVFPDVVPVAGVSLGDRIARDVENDGMMRVVKGDDPSELYDIREYRPGDRVSRMHWKLSHKSGRLMVKEFGRVVCGDALVMLDLNCEPGEAGALLTALASVSAALSRTGTAHDIVWSGGHGHRDGKSKTSGRHGGKSQIDEDHTNMGRINRSHVASERDGEEVLSSILREGGLQPEPSVLYSQCRGAKRNPYSKAIYICSSTGMSERDPSMMAKEMPHCEVKILLIAERDKALDRQANPESATSGRASPEGGSEPHVLRARPADVAAILMESAL